MQIRSRVYLHVVSRLRALGALMSRDTTPAAQEASPVLVLVAVSLALLLVILEIDLHGARLYSLALTGAPFPLDPAFMSP